MSDEGLSLRDLRRLMEQKAAEIVEKRFPGFIQKAALSVQQVLSLSIKIDEDNVFQVSSQSIIPFMRDRQKVLAETDDGEMLVFVQWHGVPGTQGNLFHVKPAKK